VLSSQEGLPVDITIPSWSPLLASATTGVLKLNKPRALPASEYNLSSRLLVATAT
jgi:hypothetical protein